ncbi:NnrS family protein [Skermanella rosea]|uniref:NnrS family protein n=1 Tax=Skermanella rosea TaxID=1817965 RepID=UPI001E35B270|nr:NnrS family protein [Skermanella rosea]UEM06316.1 NnrS family protein [Skermanella rosea]
MAAGLTVSWIPLWIGIWHGHLDLPGRLAPSAWHAHEMLFGFTSAVELAEGVTMASVHAPADVPVSRGPLPHGRTA